MYWKYFCCNSSIRIAYKWHHSRISLCISQTGTTQTAGRSDLRSKFMFIDEILQIVYIRDHISMPSFCAVFGCSNRHDREKNRSYYRLPKVINHQGEQTQKLSQARREKWLSNIARDDIKPSSYDNLRICSDHFISKLYICHKSQFPCCGKLF